MSSLELIRIWLAKINKKIWMRMRNGKNEQRCIYNMLQSIIWGGNCSANEKRKWKQNKNWLKWLYYSATWVLLSQPIYEKIVPLSISYCINGQKRASHAEIVRRRESKAFRNWERDQNVKRDEIRIGHK